MYKKAMAVLALCLVMVSVTTACFKLSEQQADETLNNQMNPTSPTATAQSPSPGTSPDSITQSNPDEVVATLYFIDNKNIELAQEKRFIPKSKTTSLDSYAAEILAELVKGPSNSAYKGPFIEGIRPPSVKVDKDNAVVDLGSDYIEKLNVGSMGENLTVYSIVNTITSIEGIETVSFTVDSKEASTINGHLDLSKPFTAKANDEF